MNWRFQVQAPQIAERFGWNRFPEILDVGGGSGMVLEAILHAHPEVRGQVRDLPGSVLHPCRPASTPTSFPTSSTTGTTITPARSSPAAAGPPRRTARCGRERTVDELVGLAAGSGLELRSSGPVADGRTVLEFGVTRTGVTR